MQFKIKEQIIFYFRYVYHKFFLILFEVRTPRFKYFIFELIYTLSKVLPFISQVPYRISIKYTVTKFGKFFLRPNSSDAVCASPAFERTDVEYLISLMQQKTTASKRILFLDIGANFGTYTVAVGNRFKNYKNLKIFSYEPSPISLELLRQNVVGNNLDGIVSIFSCALVDRDDTPVALNYTTSNPGSSSLLPISNLSEEHKQIVVKGMTLDSTAGPYLENFDVIILKIDVEGYETKVIQGGQSLFRTKAEVYFMVEDFLDDSITATLKSHQANFLAKLSPYNSWWDYQASPGKQ